MRLILIALIVSFIVLIGYQITYVPEVARKDIRINETYQTSPLLFEYILSQGEFSKKKVKTLSVAQALNMQVAEVYVVQGQTVEKGQALFRWNEKFAATKLKQIERELALFESNSKQQTLNYNAQVADLKSKLLLHKNALQNETGKTNNQDRVVALKAAAKQDQLFLEKLSSAQAVKVKVRALTLESLNEKKAFLENVIKAPEELQKESAQIGVVWLQPEAPVGQYMFEETSLYPTGMFSDIDIENEKLWQGLITLNALPEDQRNVTIRVFPGERAIDIEGFFNGLSLKDGKLRLKLSLDKNLVAQPGRQYFTQLNSTLPEVSNDILIDKGPWLRPGVQKVWVLEGKKLISKQVELALFDETTFKVISGLGKKERVVIFSSVNFKRAKEVNYESS